MRHSKYHDIGILETLEKLAFGFSHHRIPRDKVFDDLTEENPIRRDYFSKKVYELKRNGFLEYAPSQNLVLTKKGLEKINFYKLEAITLANNKTDGLWRVIIFDIPEQKRSARDLLRGKLNEFECYQLQKSVYVTPHICEKEIAQISRLLEVREHVNIILAKSLGFNETGIRRYFKI